MLSKIPGFETTEVFQKRHGKVKTAGRETWKRTWWRWTKVVRRHSNSQFRWNGQGPRVLSSVQKAFFPLHFFSSKQSITRNHWICCWKCRLFRLIARKVQMWSLGTDLSLLIK